MTFNLTRSCNADTIHYAGLMGLGLLGALILYRIIVEQASWIREGIRKSL